MADTTPENAPAANAPQSAPLSDSGHILQKPPSAKSKPSPVKKRRYQQPPETQTAKPYLSDPSKIEPAPVAAASVPQSTQSDEANASAHSDATPPPKSKDGKSDSRLNTKDNSRLKFGQDEAAPVSSGKHKKPKSHVENADKSAVTDNVNPADAQKTSVTATSDSETTPSKPTDGKPKKYAPDTPSLKTDKPGKLHFTPDESAPDTPKIHHNRKLGKAQKQADRSVNKLEKAQSKLPKKRKLRSERVFDEQKGKAKRRLYFESEVKTQGQHLKGALPLRPVKAAGNSALAFGHKKMFQVERENVATEGRYYYSVVNSGANEPSIGTGGLGTICAAGSNTITVYMTAGAKDVYIKVKDANGNVSNALKITVPAYSAQAPVTEDPPNFDNIVITGGTVVYLNPDFGQITITFGDK